MALFLMGCKTTGHTVKPKSEDNTSYELLRYKTRSGEGKKITFLYFDYENNNHRIPFSFAFVNGILQRDSIVQVSSETANIHVLISETLKQTIIIDKLKIVKGDSIVINAFLKDSNTIFE